MKFSQSLGVRPLSAMKYFFNNKRRSMSMMIAIAVSVLLVLIFQIIFYAVIESGRLTLSARLNYLTVAYPGDQGMIKDNVLSEIDGSPYLDRKVPVLAVTTDYFHFFGNLNVPIYFINKEDAAFVMQTLQLQLKTGRLPEEGKNEVMLDHRTAKNKGKNVGDYIGREVDDAERMPGKYEVVGILEGESLIGFSFAESGKLHESNGMFLIAKDDQLDQLNDLFKPFSTEEVKTMTKEYGETVFKEDTIMINMVSSIIIGVVIFIMSFAAGNLSYAQYFSRRYEFGTLQSLGYSRAAILLRAAKEILFMNLTGFAMGILLMFLTAAALNAIIFEPKGYPFVWMQYEGILKAFIIPVCTAVFSLIPAWWVMSRVDPMTVVEKFE